MQINDGPFELGKLYFEKTVRGVFQEAKFRWIAEESAERFTMRITTLERSLDLDITFEAIEQAENDPGSHQRLTKEIQGKLLRSDPPCAGLVKQV
jgi:hypothetical protein